MALSWLTLRLAWADALSHAMEQEPLERAVQLSPDNPEYRVSLASVLTAHGDDDNAVRLLKQAAGLNPHDSRVWIALGLLSESSGDREHAEQYLIRATRVDRTFDPKWALANFYYRQADVNNFWQWARQSAEMAPEGDDLADYFRVCLTLTNDVKFILEDVIPDKIAIQERFLSYLLDEHRTMDAETVAEQLIPRAGAAQTPLLLRYCEALIAANRSGPAVAVWNALAAKKLIRERPLAPEADGFLTNGDFAVPSSTPASIGAPPTRSVLTGNNHAIRPVSIFTSRGARPRTSSPCWLRSFPCFPRSRTNCLFPTRPRVSTPAQVSHGAFPNCRPQPRLQRALCLYRHNTGLLPPSRSLLHRQPGLFGWSWITSVSAEPGGLKVRSHYVIWRYNRTNDSDVARVSRARGRVFDCRIRGRIRLRSLDHVDSGSLAHCAGTNVDIPPGDCLDWATVAFSAKTSTIVAADSHWNRRFVGPLPVAFGADCIPFCDHQQIA